MRKDNLRSTRSSSRARTSERGYALAMAVILAVLYFAMIELLMLDSSRELTEARRFRSRIVALTMAENAAELAAVNFVNMPAVSLPAQSDEDEQGEYSWQLMKSAPGAEFSTFDLIGEAKTKGLNQVRSRVLVRGRIVETEVPKKVQIFFTQHTQ